MSRQYQRKKIAKRTDGFLTKFKIVFYIKPDPNNAVPKPALSRFQGAKCGRQAVGARLPDLPQVWQYRLSSFQAGDTKLERFLPESQRKY